ncbi:MAG: GNAT family N-acetyltransferase [Planctomycetaceae bacterium]|nr:GNAT family N-acetyltransferase [Planctomycetaceae bacterium]
MAATTPTPRTTPAHGTPTGPRSRGEVESQGYSCTVLEGFFEDSDFVRELRQLAATAADKNIFYEPSTLLPARRYLAGEDKWRMVLIHQRQRGHDESKRLVGFFPFVQLHSDWGISQWSLWKHPYCFLTLPLVESGHEEPVFECLFRSLKTNSLGPALLHFPLLPGDGPVHRAFVAVKRRLLLTSFIRDEFLRAIIRIPDDADEYLRDTLSGHHLREYRRQRRKLEEHGQLEYRAWSKGQPLHSWIDWFLELEASGWKGEKQTAMSCDQSHTQYFQEMASLAAENHQLRMDGLFLDGSPIALSCSLVSPPVSFGFKIAFDEQFKKFSPGTQLELERMSRGKDETISMSDSCAVPDHPMINRLWKERRIIREVTVSTGKILGELALGTIPLIRTGYRLFRRSKS